MLHNIKTAYSYKKHSAGMSLAECGGRGRGGRAGYVAMSETVISGWD